MYVYIFIIPILKKMDNLISNHLSTASTDQVLYLSDFKMDVIKWSLNLVQFWSEIILVISAQIALHSVQLHIYIYIYIYIYFYRLFHGWWVRMIFIHNEWIKIVQAN